MNPWLEFALGGGLGLAVGGLAVWSIYRPARGVDSYVAEMKRHEAFCQHLDDVLRRQKAAMSLPGSGEILNQDRGEQR